MTTVSVAIPCYRSARTLPAVVEELRAAFGAREGFDYQIILVNDYPEDDTFDVIAGLCREDPRIVGVNLSRNFGQTPAKMAALPYAAGDVIVYMDDDGQHPGDRIFELVDKVLEGYDLVFARFPKKHHSLFKRFSSWCNSKVLEWNGSKPRDLTLSSYYAMSRLAADALGRYHSPFPAPTGYLFHVVRRYANVEMEHRDRLAGQSNYTLKKMLRMWVHGLYELLHRTPAPRGLPGRGLLRRGHPRGPHHRHPEAGEPRYRRGLYLHDRRAALHRRRHHDDPGSRGGVHRPHLYDRQRHAPVPGP